MRKFIYKENGTVDVHMEIGEISIIYQNIGT